MKVAVALGAAGLAAALLAVTATSPKAASTRKRCAAGSVRAKIAGSTRCLRAGKPCRTSWDAKYHRYGFHCIDGRLRRQHLAAAPAGCLGDPVVRSQAPPPWGELVGTAPLWVGVYATLDPAANAFHAGRDRFYHRMRQGWPVKFLWVMSRAQTAPISLSLVRLPSAEPLLLSIDGQRRDEPHVATFTRSPVLDPALPGHPDTDDRPATHEWGSTVYFPRAGCYRVDAAWPGGAQHFTFGFGR